MRHQAHALILTASVVSGLAICPSQSWAQTLSPSPFAVTSPALETTDFSPNLRNVFTDTLSDFRRLPSLDSAVILSMGGLASLVGHPADKRVSNGFSSSRSMHGVFKAGETIGAATYQLGAAMATYSVGRAIGKPKVALIGADLVRAQLVSQAMTQGVKLAVGRARPDGTSYSFPSGHSASAFATAAVLQRHLGWKAGIPAYTVATYVAASRIQVQRHYLSDVAFGAAIGMIAGRTVTIGRGEARFAVAPAAAAGGAGVNFTWVGRK
ncbi:MAG TPA: phosphatase PAP2 family protein [Vicinamibacterales bacterium]|nr:phosphatase PAP2 family protein [Vicinamibacterales bacterium]